MQMQATENNPIYSIHIGLFKALETALYHRSLESSQHTKRMTVLTCILIDSMSSKPQFCERFADNNYCQSMIDVAALHDIGKIGIPDSILLKPGKLTSAERCFMQRHVVIGYDILNMITPDIETKTLLKHGKDITLCHHEHFDGTGYPNQLKGENIPLSARIVAVADVYDALVSDRCYKKAVPHKQAVKIIANGKGSQFDPAVVDSFMEKAVVFQKVMMKFHDKEQL